MKQRLKHSMETYIPLPTCQSAWDSALRVSKCPQYLRSVSRLQIRALKCGTCSQSTQPRSSLPMGSCKASRPHFSSVNRLSVGLIHSPASTRQLHASSSTDNIQLLLAKGPWEGSQMDPLNNTSPVTAAELRVRGPRVTRASIPQDLQQWVAEVARALSAPHPAGC